MNTLAINRAFTSQAKHYDNDDRQNLVLQDMRRQVYEHTAQYLKQGDSILELNAGTGIDALHFAHLGYKIHATDLADGMVTALKNKVAEFNHPETFSYEQLSYDHLDKLAGNQYDFIFSNFGGLNCMEDLTKVTSMIPTILKKRGYVTWVIMPPVCLWEIMWILKGRPVEAFRRFKRNGANAFLEGENFKTYYHSLRSVRAAFGKRFTLVRTEGLCSLSPPPSKTEFPIQHPALYKRLRAIDSFVRNSYPFNRWADHFIATFRLD